MTRIERVRGPEADGGTLPCRGGAGAKPSQFLFAGVGARLAELVQISAGQAAERSFDALLCPLPANRVTDWNPAVAPGNWAAFSLYGTLVFEPLRSLYVARVRRHGVELPQGDSFHLAPVTDAESARGLLWDMGLRGIRIYAEQLSYRVSSAAEWWEIVSRSALGRTAAQLPAAQLERLKAEHLAEVNHVAAGAQLSINLPTFFAMGCRPRA